MMEKNNLRKYISGLRNGLPEIWRREADEMIAGFLCESTLFKSSPTIFCYVSRPDEIDTRRIIEVSLSVGKAVAVPKTFREDHHMEFVRIESIHELKQGKFGILEPVDTCQTQTADQNTLCLIPALCTDVNGHRLGFGGGYYDRFLKDFPGKSVIMAYEFLSKSSIPVETHDVAANIVLTEKGFRNIAK